MKDIQIQQLENIQWNIQKNHGNNGPIWKLVHSIHLSIDTRELTPLEAIPMKPFYYKNGIKTYLLTLLSIPSGSSTESLYLSPFGCLVWEYPEVRFIKIINLTGITKEQPIYLSEKSVATKVYCNDLEKEFRGEESATYLEVDLLKIYKEIIQNEILKNKEQAMILDKSSGETEISSNDLFKMMSETKQLIIDFKMDFLLEEWKKIYGRMLYSGFTVAVVGEFSRGKSTLINKILNQEILPVGNLPTTAMLTKLIYGSNPGLEYILADGKREQLPLISESWEKLVVNLFNDSPEGVVKIELPEKWLQKTGIQIIDTPGAGDLSDQRALIVDDAITGCDGAIVVINAIMPLSLTERAFIEQHLIAKKVPYIMIVITRLDQIAVNERKSVIDYVKNKLILWGVNVPVYIPQNSNILNLEQYHDITGIEKIKAVIEEWVTDSRHNELKEKSIYVQIQDLLTIIKGALMQEKKMLHLSNEEKVKALKSQKEKIEKLALRWEEYRLQMLKRSNICSEWMRKTVDEKKDEVIERLTFELTHTSNPKEWWNNDLPYRLKQEQLHLAHNMESGLNQMFMQDLKWLNDSFLKDFSMVISIEKEQLSVKDYQIDYDLFTDIKDTNQIRMFLRIGAGAATLIGYTLFGPFGIAASVGGGIISEILMGKNIEKQKEDLKKLIVDIVTKNFNNALAISEKRIQGIYDKSSVEAAKQEKIWLSVQNDSINRATRLENVDLFKLDQQLQTTQNKIDKINKLLGE